MAHRGGLTWLFEVDNLKEQLQLLPIPAQTASVSAVDLVLVKAEPVPSSPLTKKFFSRFG